MNSSPETPIYNLKAVVQETGLKPDTLRAWERRYGLPEPERTESGHRLYSQNDIQLLKWLLGRQSEGMSISRAVDLWRRLRDENVDPLSVMAQRPVNQPANGPPALVTDTATRLVQGNAIAELRQSWITALLNFDEKGAEQEITQAFALFPVEVVCSDLIMQGLAEIGRGWHEGTITVQQEHFASALAMRRLEILLAATPPPTRLGRILVGCAPEEEHTLAPLMLSLMLRRRGWDIVFLGANVPVQNLILTIRTAHPQLVILTAQLLYTAANLAEVAESMRKENIPVAFGGRIFNQLPAIRQRIAGHFLGDQIEGSQHTIERIMAAPQPRSATEAPSLEYQLAYHSFRMHRANMEADVWRTLGDFPGALEYLGKANFSFSRTVGAALALGNIEFAGLGLEEVSNLLINQYQIPVALINHYLQAYLQAAEHYHQPEVIINWLRRLNIFQ